MNIPHNPRFTTLVGPLKTEKEAVDTMNAFGYKNHTYFGRAKNKADPDTGEEYTDFTDMEWFVERINDIVPDRIFGQEWETLKKRQYK